MGRRFDASVFDKPTASDDVAPLLYVPLRRHSLRRDGSKGPASGVP